MVAAQTGRAEEGAQVLVHIPRRTGGACQGGDCGAGRCHQQADLGWMDDGLGSHALRQHMAGGCRIVGLLVSWRCTVVKV